MTKAVNKTSPLAPTDVTTLPSLPDAGEVKSRRKPSLKDQEGSEIEQNDKNVLPSDTTDTKKIDIQKDGESKSVTTLKKVTPKKSYHGKKEIRNDEENDKDKKIDRANLSTNITSIPHKVISKVNNITTSSGIIPESTTEKIMKIEGETKVIPKAPTETPFNVHNSIVKIIPLKQDTKPLSKTTTPKR